MKVRGARIIQTAVGLAVGAALWSAGHPLAGAAVFGLVGVALPWAVWWWFERPRPQPHGRALLERIRIEEQVLAEQRALLGDDHPETLTARNNLALDYTEAGRAAEAIEHFEVALTYGVHIQGRHHPETLILRRNLTEAYRAAGRPRAALSQLELAYHGALQVHGPRHRETRSCRIRLARLRREAAAGNPPLGCASTGTVG